MNELTTKENINIEIINKFIVQYFDNLNFCIYLQKSNTNFENLYFEFSNFRPRTMHELKSGIDNLKKSNFELKLKVSFLKNIFNNFQLTRFMNFEQKENINKDIEKLATNFEVNLQNVLSLINGYISNIDNVIYDSITSIAGKLTSRTSQYKTNSNAFKFQDKHILNGALCSYSYYNSNHIMGDIVKIHNLFFNDKIDNWKKHIKFNWEGNNEEIVPEIISLSENLSIRVFKNKNVHVLFSLNFQNKLNNMIQKNILK